MSVQALSPFSGSKRLFEEHPEDTASPSDRGQGKRGRYVAGSPSGRCSGPLVQAVHPGTLEALRGLFPGMDDQTVTAVLVECGNDIDAAIRRLNQLRIETDAAAQQQQQGADAVAAQPGSGGDKQQDQQQQVGSAAAAAEAASQRQEQQQQQAAGTAAPGADGPQTADQWVDALVGEMAQASNIPDARSRAAKLLHSFEQFVATRVAASGAGGAASSSAAAAPQQLQARLDEAQRENAILKRAVQIQNARMQEAASKEGELAGLKQLVAQYQERLRHLELSNYSLALHLQKATGNAPVTPGHNPPDVY